MSRVSSKAVLSWKGKSHPPLQAGFSEALARAKRDCEAPEMIALRREPSGDTMFMGIGAELSVITTNPGDSMPPYYVSHSPSRSRKQIVFMIDGAHTEFSSSNGVPPESAELAFLEFFETGSLSEAIRWKEV